ncbi:MAG: alkaline phosphatase family protein [Gemmatimonadaceae bacterium]
MGTDTPENVIEPRRRKLLVLALDAAEPALIREWAGDGTLPNIAALMAQGLVGATQGDDALYVGSTWPSFYTAVNPGRHGIYWIDRLVPGDYRVRRTSPADFARTPALWDVLGAAGRRVMVCDVPLSHNATGLHGVMLSEWGAHDALFGFSTEPPELAREILSTFGAHPVPAACDSSSRTLAEYREFAALLIRGAHDRAELTKSLLAREPWDFAIQVFSEAHCAGHQLWHFHDPKHPAFDHATTTSVGNLVCDVYVAIDTAIGEILRSVDDDTTVVLLSLHGMSYMAGNGPLLGAILERLGVFARDGSEAKDVIFRDTPSTLRHVLRSLGRRAKRAYHKLPLSVRAPLYEARQRVNREVLDRGSPMNVEPDRSHCYPCEMGPCVSGIRINLEGREFHGIVHPGADEQAFVDGLIRDLMDIVDPGTQRKLVRRVFRTSDVFHGARLDELPDLIIEWDLEQPVGTAVAGVNQETTRRASSPRIGVVELENRYCRTGEHRSGGVFIARGPGIQAAVLSREVRTLDLAPTFAAMIGCHMPNVDGRIIPELVQG